jgi:hypothetical protein
VPKRGIRVIDLEDFMCRCGSTDFERISVEDKPTGLTCRGCGRRYSVKKIEKRARLTNLPMSFGFRSLYWDKIETSGGSLQGVTERGYEIREIKEEE